MKKTIGVMGTPQIMHIIPILEKEYDVINLQQIWDGKGSIILKTLQFMNALRKVDLLYNVFTSPYFWKKACIANIMNKKIVTHCIGTDVKVATEGKTNIKKLGMIKLHMCCFEPLQYQMKTVGIETELVPIVPFNLKFEISNMPKKHTVLIYMPGGVENDYGFDEISRVFPQYPELQFYIVANDDKCKFSEYTNVGVVGRLSLEEMELLYDKISMIIRIHKNDGLSMSVLEAMAKGKKIIWNCEFPMCLPGSTTTEICNSLDELLKEPPMPDKQAHDYIVTEYSPDNILAIYKRLFEKI